MHNTDSHSGSAPDKKWRQHATRSSTSQKFFKNTRLFPLTVGQNTDQNISHLNRWSYIDMAPCGQHPSDYWSSRHWTSALTNFSSSASLLVEWPHQGQMFLQKMEDPVVQDATPLGLQALPTSGALLHCASVVTRSHKFSKETSITKTNRWWCRPLNSQKKVVESERQFAYAINPAVWKKN